MGCDIHLILERQTLKGWVATDTFNYHHSNERTFSFPVARNRNYRRFSALAGVRGDGPQPKGLPDDLSQTAQYVIDQWGDDGHSHSWLPLLEAIKIFLDTNREYSEDPLEEIKYPHDYFFNIDEEEIDQYRLIFFFDN